MLYCTLKSKITSQLAISKMFFTNSLENQLRQWNDTIKSQPNNANAYIRRGMVYFKLANIETSIQDFDQAEKLDPNITP